MMKLIGLCCLCCYLGSAFALPLDRLTIAHSSSSPQKVLKARVKLVAAAETDKPPAYGVLTLFETSQGVYIKGKILGLEPGKHGFHVHQEGQLGNNCKDAAGHFNPAGKNHGKPEAEDQRHVGDLGNIVTPSDGGITHVNVLDKVITLVDGDVNSIAGRAFVVHAGQDDLGLGENAESLKTGNAGRRLACGIVELVN